MKKFFSKIWSLVKRHKILSVVCFLAIIVVILMMVVALRLFVGGNDKYGNRLDGIEEVEVTSGDKKELVSKLEKYEEVVDATARVQGRIIYISIKYKDGTSVDDAKNIANSSLDSLDKKQKKFYEIGYFLTSEGENSFYITGSKNAKLDGISWIKS